MYGKSYKWCNSKNTSIDVCLPVLCAVCDTCVRCTEIQGKNINYVLFLNHDEVPPNKEMFF